MVVIIPIIIELGDAVLAGLVLGRLGGGEFEGGDAADLEGLDVGVVAAAGDDVGLDGDAQLFGLVVELLGKDENVLAEVLRLLTELAADDVAVRLGHAALPFALAPVEEGDGDAHLNNLVAQQVAVGTAQVVGGAGVAELGVEADGLAVGAGGGDGVVGL